MPNETDATGDDCAHPAKRIVVDVGGVETRMTGRRHRWRFEVATIDVFCRSPESGQGCHDVIESVLKLSDHRADRLRVDGHEGITPVGPVREERPFVPDETFEYEITHLGGKEILDDVNRCRVCPRNERLRPQFRESVKIGIVHREIDQPVYFGFDASSGIVIGGAAFTVIETVAGATLVPERPNVAGHAACASGGAG